MYGYPFVGAPAPTASQIFASLQQAIRSQDVRSLVWPFNEARINEGRYGGLAGAQLDPKRNPNYPRRLVIWQGRTPFMPGVPGNSGSPLAPVGVFETYTPGNFEALFQLLNKADPANPTILYGFGFEGIPEPERILMPQPT